TASEAGRAGRSVLATGEHVELFVDRDASRADVRAHTALCDRLARLRHPLLAPLADYGAWGARGVRGRHARRLLVRGARPAAARATVARAAAAMGAAPGALPARSRCGADRAD